MNEVVHIGIAIIVDASKAKTVVGVRPSDVHLAGMHEFPGGKVEANESAEECAIREAFEETGLKVDVIEAWAAIEFEYPERTVVLYPSLCEADEDQKLKSPWDWVEIGSLDEGLFPEANRGMIARLKT